MSEPCTAHAHLTDEQRHILLDGHDAALVRLAAKHDALVAALRALEAELREEGVRDIRHQLWADKLAALLTEHGG